MKYLLSNTLYVFIVLFSMASFSQEEHPELFETDSTVWIKEIIKFPLGFAPEIPYEGFEDLRFVKAGWGKQEHPEFWSYAFAWYIKTDKAPTLKEIEQNIQLYYDGLMKAVNKDKSFTVPKSIVSFQKTDINKYIGTIKCYDSFYTKEMITLNVLINASKTNIKDECVVLFKVSLQDFSHDVWKKLNGITLKKGSFN